MVRFARCPAALMASLVLALVGCTARTDAAQGGSPSSSSSAPHVSVADTASSTPEVSSADTPLYEAFTVRAEPPPAEAEPAVSAAENTAPGFLAPLSAAWAKSGQTLYVTTYGSGSCPTVVELLIKVVNTKPQRLILRTSNPDNPRGTAPQSCTMDLSPTTSTVSVPIDINPAESLTLVVDDRTLVLPGRR